MFGFLKNIFFVVALVALVYFASRYAGTLKSEVLKFLNIPGSSVAGISTKKADEISGKISSDLSGQAKIIQNQILNLTFRDMIEVIPRLQKIPQDFNILKDYTEEKVNDMLKSKK